jgi:hypothetical protein
MMTYVEGRGLSKTSNIVNLNVKCILNIYVSTPRRLDRVWSHPASYPVGTGGSFAGVNAAGA